MNADFVLDKAVGLVDGVGQVRLPLVHTENIGLALAPMSQVRKSEGAPEVRLVCDMEEPGSRPPPDAESLVLASIDRSVLEFHLRLPFPQRGLRWTR